MAIYRYLVETMGVAGLWVTAVIGLVIITLFFLLAWQYLWPLHKAASAMRRAKGRVTGVNDAPEKIFPKEKQARLRELWEDFIRDREGTTHPHRGRDISTLDPAEIFYEDAVFGAYNRNFAVTLAGFFTGLGIFGTFLGLVIGLGQIDTSPGQMFQSVGGLVGGMSTAFYTSLIGIFFSLAWLVLDRVLLDRVQKATNEFLHAVRNKYPVESPDRLLHHLLNVEQSENEAIHASKQLLEEQKGILQSLTVDLAVALEEAFTASLDKKFMPKLEEMTGAIEGLSTQIGDRQVEALDEMVRTFQDRLSSELHGHLDSLASSLSKAAEWQERVHSQLGSLTDRLSDAAGRQAELVEATNSAASTFSNSLSALGQANQHITESLTALRSAAEGLGNVADDVTAQAEILGGRIEELGHENEAYRNANENIRVQLATQIETLDTRLEELDQFWNKLGSELENAGKQLKAGASEFSALTTQKLQEIFSRFDSEMATVVEHLAGTLAEIREVTDDLPRNVSAFGENLSVHAEGLTTAGEKLEQTTKRLEALEQVAQTLGRLEPLRGSMDEVSRRMGSASAELAQLVRHVQAVDGRLADFVSRVVTGVDGGRGTSSGAEQAPTAPRNP